MSIEIELAAQEVLIGVIAEQHVAAKALRVADKEVETGLECIELYTRAARVAIDDLSNCVDEESAEAAVKQIAWNIEEVLDIVRLMGPDVERLRDAWLAHHRGEEEGQE